MELGREGVRVNCVAPGVVRTRFSELLWKNNGDTTKMFGNHLERHADPYEMAVSTLKFLVVCLA